jgi:hypothetical protein
VGDMVRVWVGVIGFGCQYDTMKMEVL